MTATQFRRWRERMRWTQVDAGQFLDLDPKTISNYECGVVSITQVVKLATERLEEKLKAA